jgi:hypothetical protein
MDGCAARADAKVCDPPSERPPSRLLALGEFDEKTIIPSEARFSPGGSDADFGDRTSIL